MNKIYVKYEHIPICYPYGREFISVKYTDRRRTLNNAHEIYNLENYNNIGSLYCWPIRDIIEQLRPNKFRLPQNLRYLCINTFYDYKNLNKEHIDQIEFPDKLHTFELESSVIDIDINCNIDKLVISSNCENIISLPKNVKYIVYETYHLWYHSRILKSFPVSLPQILVHLDCSRGLLTKLPKLPDTLEYLLCDSNELTELPKLPPNLKELICYNNKLTKLPELPKSIVYLNCFKNNIDELPLSLMHCKLNEWLHYCETYINRCKRTDCTPRYIPNCKCYKLKIPTRYTPYRLSNKNNYKKLDPPYFGFIYNDNPIAKEINKYPGKNRNNRKLKKYFYYKMSVLKIEEWYLECKYNPKFKFCRDRLENQFKDLYDDK